MLKHLPKAFLTTLTGPKRLPNRSFAEQMMFNALKDLIASGQGKGIAHLREQMEGLSAQSPGMSRVNFSDTKLAGIACMQAEPKTGADQRRVVLYLHGGGYITGSPSGYKALIADIAANANCLVIAPDYRLAPEAPFPAAQDDCLAVAEACKTEYSDLRFTVAGDSAGGALAIATTQGLFENTIADVPPVDSLVLISPWVDPMAEGGSILANAKHDFLMGAFLQNSFEALMQGHDKSDPRVNFSHADLSNLPRTLVQYGTGELFKDQIEAFSARAKSQGVKLEVQAYSDQCHDFQFFTAVSATARGAVRNIGEFIREQD